ncbi:hypothetical protein [Terrarubrum flagellatum]|uniref:hypothetical protein n=1 Tax=Terrirubrum flagellatum TaxID=2895980 RepID=UPI0031452D9A
MPRAFPKEWFVFESIENDQHDRCVDLFKRPDGTFGYDEFRRDIEDGGAWTPTGGFWGLVFSSRNDALAAAREAVAWLGAQTR